MLLYLNGRTWTSGEASVALSAEVRFALDHGISLLLVHEMPGVIETDANRCSVEFDTFFQCDRGATPPDLIAAGVYSLIAISLKGGSWRQTGLALVVDALCEDDDGGPLTMHRAMTRGMREFPTALRDKLRRRVNAFRRWKIEVEEAPGLLPEKAERLEASRKV